ncbi:MAG: T9SS type A sorting domain-containing protein [Bacteroidales bacterium]|nr:T9SS type A sorting domain-containing protein [Bacteroidales bacterium]
MRKIITLMLATMAIAPVMVEAQTVDTLYPRDGKLEGYYYSTWYSDCETYDSAYPAYRSSPNIQPFWFGKVGGVGVGPFLSSAKGDTTEHPIAITGVGVWQINRADRRPGTPVGDAPMSPEYIFIYQCERGNDKDSLRLLAIARWDTAQPKTLMLPITNDSTGTTAHSGYMSCELYEIALDTPVVVNSLFYMVGTLNNNLAINNNLPTPTFTQYAYLYPPYYNADCRFPNMPWAHIFLLDDTTMTSMAVMRYFWGLYMPRVDFAEVDVQVNDAMMGSAGPSGQLSKWTTQTFTAEARPGYTFVRWSDGDNSNPRDVYITQDTTLVALFVSDTAAFSVTTQSNAEPFGHVTGGGNYLVGDTVTLTAFFSDTLEGDTVQERLVFRHWNDGDTSNPRQFVVFQDTAFTAFFYRDYREMQGLFVERQDYGFPHNDTVGIPLLKEEESAFTLTPNPTMGVVTVQISNLLLSGSSVLSVTDILGREVMEYPVNGESIITIHLENHPVGLYLVTLKTPQGVYTQRLSLKR